MHSAVGNLHVCQAEFNQHWVLNNGQSCRCTSEQTLDQADNAIRAFIRKFKRDIWQTELTPNIHMLLHITDDMNL